MENKRLPMIKAKIEEITKGEYILQEGFNPNYIITREGEKLSRVRILSTVVDKFVAESGKFASITIDDGTETVRAKAFNDLASFENISAGDDIEFIGKVKEYQGEVYLVPETIRKVEDPNLQLLHHLEVQKRRKEWAKKREAVFENQKSVSDLEELKILMQEKYGVMPEETETILSSKPSGEPHEAAEGKTRESPKDTLVKIIAENDSGKGCEYQTLISKSGLEEDVIDSTIQELLDEGSCFEPKPGVIKML